ncbi:S1 domain-containing post-transcriptional regulator GSP13 [Bacillus xiapuensis]|uniref:S1 domain-containing post-transcriptional regulator GSP13 n=1 Tax=Bacillus xiapuensis TaxID=2014075 RepID=UPI000C245A98|nr:S1 domain-containing post-transcriptional regulator GSP13 [Bacillus xiapuensis]
MATHYQPGQLVTGKVTGIQPYGAFIALDNGTQGLVHISEITHGYVRDIHDHLQVGETVKVKVISVNEEEGKISLSIRATEEAKPAAVQSIRRLQLDKNKEGFNTLKDKLQEWIEQSGESR